MEDKPTWGMCAVISATAGIIAFVLGCLMTFTETTDSLDAQWQRAAISRGYATWEETSDGDTEFVWLEREAGGDD